MSRDRLSAYRALASGSRVEILHVLQRASGPMTVAEVAAEVGLHQNTTREHLDQLIEAGFAASEPEVRLTRGRPRLRYHAVERAAVASPDVRAQAQLARLLVTGYGAAMESPAEAARTAGRQWGRTLVDPAPDAAEDPAVTDPAAAQLAALTGHLDELGFDPEVDPDGTAIHLRRCPFLDLARERTDVVCSVHLGLSQGVLAAVPGPVRATRLDPFVGPQHCVLHLRVDT